MRYTARHARLDSSPVGVEDIVSFGTTCLARPAAFPKDLNGAPWGSVTIRVELPGGPYIFRGLETEQARWVRYVFADRARSLDDTHSLEAGSVVTDLFRAPRDAFLDFERVDWKILIDVDYRPDGLRLAAHQWMGRVAWPGEHDPQTTTRGALWTPVTSGSAFTDLFENYFRILVAYRLLGTGGLLLHSAGVADDHGGYVFPGASGNGKSTLSKISLREGLNVLSDDGNALSIGPDETGRTRVWIEALPFGGEMRDRPKPRGRFPLRRISALRKGPDNRLDPLSRAQATSLLLGCCPFVNGDPNQTSDLLETIEHVLRHVPTSTLTFTKAGGFWPLLHEAQRGVQAPNHVKQGMPS